jgi:hypothetical protein
MIMAAITTVKPRSGMAGRTGDSAGYVTSRKLQAKGYTL